MAIALNRENIRKLGAFLNKDGSMSAIRTLVGVGLGAAVASSIGMPAVIAITAGIVGFTALAHRAIERERNENLLDTYRTEISHMLGKDEKSLTLDDLSRAAKSPENSKGSTAIQMAMEHFADTRKFFITSQAVTAGLMVAALSVAAASPLLANVPAIGLAGAAGALYNELFSAVANIHTFMTSDNIKGAVTREIRAINKQVSMGGGISSTRVLDILVSADPVLQQVVHDRFNQDYENLSIAEKREAVNMLDEKTHVIQLAKDINSGHILPTELAFIAFGESSGTPRNINVPETHMNGDDAEHTTKWQDKVASLEESYVKQMDIEQHQAADGSRIIH